MENKVSSINDTLNILVVKFFINNRKNLPDVDLFKIYEMSLDCLEGSPVQILSLHNKIVQFSQKIISII